MGTSANNQGGTGGGWTEFKRSASYFARYGGSERAAKTLAGFVAALGGAAAAASGGSAAQTGQSLGTFLANSTGPGGLAGGLEAVGLERLVGQDRFTVLSELIDAFGGNGGAVEEQAARDALLDVLDELLPEGDETALEAVQLDEAGVREQLCRYMAALVYNLAIPVIEVRLEALENQTLIQQRDGELRSFIDELVRLKMHGASPLTVDWQGAEGKEFVQGILQAVYEQLEAGQ